MLMMRVGPNHAAGLPPGPEGQGDGQHQEQQASDGHLLAEGGHLLLHRKPPLLGKSLPSVCYTKILRQYGNADASNCMSVQLDEAAIKGIFEQFGPVVSVTIVKDNLNRSKGFGFVEVRRRWSIWFIISGIYFL